MRHSVRRREFLSRSGAALLGAALAGCSFPARQPGRAAPPGPTLQLPPLHASADRITAITVCTRPFRAQGPRLDVERMQGKTVVHNYGHGGSGWSLSWGSSSLAVEKALATGERQVAVIGCGALGLTSALLLQRAGARVTIYAKDLPPNVRSSLATGVFTPDSRICFEQCATPAFRQAWEGMARRSFTTFQTFLGLPGEPVEFYDNYFVTDTAERMRRAMPADDARPRFAELQRELLGDLLPRTAEYAPGSHPFGARYVRGGPQLMFNLSAYTRLLMSDYLANGGQIVIDEFHSPADFARVREKTLINATGYGARALLGDQSLTPVRGQLARMIPQPEIRYGLIHRGVAFVPRRDGLVFQVIGQNDYYGFGDQTSVPDRAEAELAVNTIGGLFNPG
jgi:glycine/D-amino acid oxidase-like deaminating enzyme